MLKFTNRLTAHAVTALLFCCFAATAQAQSGSQEMSFFITSVGKGDGANLGGLEGADAHCNALASAAGSSKTFAAYLSTSMSIDRSADPMTITNGISARDRIGSGPWYNANGELIANNVEDLHSDGGICCEILAGDSDSIVPAG